MFLTLWENAASFDCSRGAAFSSAVTPTRNRAIDRLRIRAYRSRILVSSMPADLGYGDDGAPGAESLVDLADRAIAVRSAIAELPALASEKDYQLWVIDKQYPSPVNAGVFVVDPVTGEAHIVFKADKHVDSIAKFAVSLERKGGVAKAEGPIVLLSQ